MEIQVGDRVTYKYKEEVFERLVTCEKDLNEFRYGIEILKIERPKYEVVEKKELLTEEEREFLRLYMKVNDIKAQRIRFSIFEINYIDENKTITSWINTEESFSNIKFYKEYTLSELGLEE